MTSDSSVYLNNTPNFVSQMLFNKKSHPLNNKSSYLGPYLFKGSRGSLPYTFNIPESIPEVPVSPRHHSVSFSLAEGHMKTSSQHSRSPSSLLDDIIIEPSESDKCVSPLRTCDLAVPCSSTFEEALKTLEQDSRDGRDKEYID
ncbi:unnamed protein product [Trichobilharzia regenti]|uniref:GAB2 n=1 Tax=Trichobilharzia regenti TaxID=157069 RepID=A0A183VPN8_TRIRE|nr:unnamed protein product [Trichobilharzia regenti]CAH8870306.1 unnamed protein product [Trichobilharzia regenti]VDP98323.1 unnamed protein product [Trichobilharzia regenti]